MCRTYGAVGGAYSVATNLNLRLEEKILRMGENNDNQSAVKVRRTYSFVVNRPPSCINAVGVVPKVVIL
jgi:hypothetical protein